MLALRAGSYLVHQAQAPEDGRRDLQRLVERVLGASHVREGRDRIGVGDPRAILIELQGPVRELRIERAQPGREQAAPCPRLDDLLLALGDVADRGLHGRHVVGGERGRQGVEVAQHVAAAARRGERLLGADAHLRRGMQHAPHSADRRRHRARVAHQ